MKKQYVLLLITVVFLLPGYSQDEYLISEYKEHKGIVNSVAFSKSGKYLASGGEDKLLVIRDLTTRNADLSFPDNYFPIKDMEFFGDIQLFVTAGRDIKLIDLTNTQLALYKGSATHIWSLDFAPERNKLTAGSYDKTLNMWDVRSQEVDFELLGHKKSALTIAFSKDEKYLASGSRDLTIKIWSAKTGELLHSLEKHSENIYDIEFHPNTKYFATGSGDNTIRLWDVELGAVVKTYAGHEKSVVDIDFSPDGYFMYSASVDGVVYVWELSTGKKIHSFVKHVGGVNSVTASNDGHYVATAGNDGMVFLWKSAKAIVVDLNYADKIVTEKAKDSIFLPKQKGESKDEYFQRKAEAAIAEEKLVEKFFIAYLQKSGLKKIPVEGK